MEVPEELKYLSQFLQRGVELQGKEDIISYYCKLYAMKLAFQKSPTSEESKQFLLKLMDQLEKEKQVLSENEAISNDTIGYAHIENFALRIFLSADNEDRAGKASRYLSLIRKTAKTFVAASVFLELLKIFGELDQDTIQKIKYSKFKATDILKALKEGRVPTPGLGETTPTNDTMEEPTAPSIVPQPSFPTIPVQPVQQSSARVIPNLDEIEDPVDDDNSYNEQERQKIMQAGKYAKFAQSALLYDDVSTAIENLEKAMLLLKPLRLIE